MEKLLRTSDDDILVYVAPTKALVSQIAAEVYARFRKELGSSKLYMYASISSRLIKSTFRGLLGYPYEGLPCA